MNSSTSIRPATSSDAALIGALLTKTTRWLKERNMPLWSEEMFCVEKIGLELSRYRYFVAEEDGSVVGTFRLQFDDPEIWPEISSQESIFIHRIAVDRVCAGCGVAQQMIEHAKRLTQEAGRRFLRLDCAAERPKLRKVYEDAGFSWRDDVTCGPFRLSRYEWESQLFVSNTVRGSL